MDMMKALTSQYMKNELPEMNIGDTVPCKIAEIDSQGRINLLRTDMVYEDESMPVRRPPKRDGDRDRRPRDRDHSRDRRHD